MQVAYPSCLLRLFLITCLMGFGGFAVAQSTGLLYDPEPPADSAYVRVIFASPEGPVDVLIDGQARVRNLRTGEASDYMVLVAGKHSITLRPSGKSTTRLTTSVDVVRGRAVSLAFLALAADSVPLVFEDKANSNKLKALLSVYHLDAKSGPLDVTTADKVTQVFSHLTFGKSNSIQVNPISIELISTPVGGGAAGARATLSMAQGATYSMLLLPAANGKSTANVTQNKIERYTGK